MFWKGKMEENLHSMTPLCQYQKGKTGNAAKEEAHSCLLVGVLACCDMHFQLIIYFLGRMMDLLVGSLG